MIVALLQPHAIVPCFGSGWYMAAHYCGIYLTLLVSARTRLPTQRGRGGLVQFHTQHFTVRGISEA